MPANRSNDLDKHNDNIKMEEVENEEKFPESKASLQVDSDKMDESMDHWSGSGIWEKEENRKWEVVNVPVIPSLSQEPKTLNGVADIGIFSFLKNFEKEVSTSTKGRLVHIDDTVIRITDEDENEDSSNESDEPQPGPSGLSNNVNNGSRSPTPIDELTSESGYSAEEKAHETQGVESHPSPHSSQQTKRKNGFWCRQRKKRRYRKRRMAQWVRSANSSPGRKSPSPERLAELCQAWKQEQEEEEEQKRRMERDRVKHVLRKAMLARDLESATKDSSQHDNIATKDLL